MNDILKAVIYASVLFLAISALVWLLTVHLPPQETTHCVMKFRFFIQSGTMQIPLFTCD